MLKLPVAVLHSPMYTWPTTITLASNTCMMDCSYTKTEYVLRKSLKDTALGQADTALGRRPASPRHLLPTPRYHQPIHPYIPRHPPPTLVRKDIAWTNTTRHPPHPPMAPYTPVNLQSPTSHPPTAHQTPVRKKKNKNHPTPREPSTAKSTKLR
ncbi:hypothetical protein QQF64_007863 [Cirrhinus molitorella]|uniref:Uncharacterized protein n=1 Tax=Cirrhinus molitorella TaxID=172907 RepID=A0ABR3M726_9TELE